MKNKDYRKDVDPALAAIAAKKEQNKLKQERNQKEVEVSGTVYVIKKWKHTDTLSRLPAFANFLYVPAAIIAADNLEDENGLLISDDPATPSVMINMLFDRMQDIEFSSFVAMMLDQVYLKENAINGSPVDLDEDIDNPIDIITLVSEVAQANFMIGLCTTMSTIAPQMLAAQTLTKDM